MSIREKMLARKRKLAKAKNLHKHTSAEPANGSVSPDAGKAPLQPTTPKPAPTNEVTKAVEVALGKNDITLDMLNEEQRTATKLMALPADNKDSFVLMGAAGSGKTTTVKLGVQEALQHGAAKHYATEGGEDETTRYNDNLREADELYFAQAGANEVLQRGAPRIAVISFTNVAVRNIREILPSKLRPHCTTFHKLLGYAPEEMDVAKTDADGMDTGEFTTIKPFTPKYGVEPTTGGGRGYGLGQKLAHLDIVVVEEAGTVPTWLYETLIAALPYPEKTKFVFLGDIQQLDPAFGDGIIGYKMLELPCIELTHTYRNVGLITKFAHRILEGRPIGPAEAKTWSRTEGKDSIQMMPFKRSAYPDVMNKMLGQMLKKLIVAGEYDEHSEVVLMPFNKEFGTIQINKWIMQAITERDGLKVHEVITNRESHYFCVGDKVLHNKQYYEVKEIKENPTYTGSTKPFPPSKFIDRWGRRRLPRDGEEEEYELEREALADLARGKKLSAEEVESMLESSAVDDEQGSNAASHELVLQPWLKGTEAEDSPGLVGEITIKSASALNSLVLPYALTVYKAQGSEWETVWLVMHQSHSVALKRELFYTGVTRARSHLKLIYSDVGTTGSTSHDSLTKAIVRQSIPGITLEDKRDYFRKKMNMDGEKQRLRDLREQYSFGKTAAPTEL